MNDLSKLMLEAQKGIEGSYSELLLQTSLIIDKYLSKKILSSDERDEMVNNILSTCHNNRHTYTSNVSYHAWLFSITKIYMKTYYKRISKIQNDKLIIKIDILKNKLDIEKKIQKPNVELNINIFRDYLKNKLGISYKYKSKFPPFQEKILYLLLVQNHPLDEVSQKLRISQINLKIIVIRLLEKFEEGGDEN